MSKQDGGSLLRGITKVRSSCIEKELLQIHWYLEAESKLASWSNLNRSPCAVLRRPKVRMVNICKWVLNKGAFEPEGKSNSCSWAMGQHILINQIILSLNVQNKLCAEFFFFLGGGRVGCPASLRVTVKSRVRIAEGKEQPSGST